MTRKSAYEVSCCELLTEVTLQYLKCSKKPQNQHAVSNMKKAVYAMKNPITVVGSMFMKIENQD